MDIIIFQIVIVLDVFEWVGYGMHCTTDLTFYVSEFILIFYDFKSGRTYLSVI